MPTTSLLPSKRTSTSTSSSFLTAVKSPRALVNFTGQLQAVTVADVIHGSTCSPLTLRHFEHYLTFVEHSPEGLRFLVWWHDHRRRYYALPEAVRARSFGSREPQHLSRDAPNPVRTQHREQASIQVSEHLRLNYVQRSSGVGESSAPPAIEVPAPVQVSRTPSMARLLSRGTAPPAASSPFSPTFDLRTSPREQPLRAECDRAIATFLRPGASAELNLCETVRETVARDLTWNTHPDVWMPVYEDVYEALERESLPRFLSFAAKNINLPRQIAQACTGVVFTVASVVIAISLTRTLHARAWRIIAVLCAYSGVLCSHGAYRGLCYVQFFHRSRQLRSWEMEGMDEEAGEWWEDIVRQGLGEKPRGQQTSEGAESKERATIAPWVKHVEEGRRKSGGMFGPTTVVKVCRIDQGAGQRELKDWLQDPRIRAVQREAILTNQVLAVTWALIFGGIVLSVPECVC